jgi:dihydroorotase
MANESTTLTIIRPDDWHLHFRDGVVLNETVPATARVFGRAIVMPNLAPPVVNVAMANAYYDRIMAAVPQGVSFEPLMTLYLTDNTSVDDIAQAATSEHVVACKLYPAGATTNSDNGVTDPKNIYPVLEAMEKHDILLLVHGEVTHSDIDIFDREKAFIDQHMKGIRKTFPNLRIVFEHITTADAVDYVLSHDEKMAATITPQHLMMNRNDLLVGGIRPHNYCLPVLKRRTHQLRLQEAAISADPRFFLGTDSAPHAKSVKETACGCAGCYSARAALPLYATFFEQMNALDKLEGFASFFGADFYGMPRHTDTVTLHRDSYTIEAEVKVGQESFVPWMAGETIPWRIAD